MKNVACLSFALFLLCCTTGAFAASPLGADSAELAKASSAAAATTPAPAAPEASTETDSPLMDTVLDQGKTHVNPAADCFVCCADAFNACKHDCPTGFPSCNPDCYEQWQFCKMGCSSGSPYGENNCNP